MKTKAKWSILLFTLLILIFAAFFILRQPIMTEAEMEARIDEIYGGVTRNIVHDDNNVIIAFTRGKSMYEVTMDARTGTFSNLHIIFEEPPEQVKDTEQTTETTTILTPEEANTIATSKYFGTVQTNRFIEDGDAGYYEIEIASNTQHYTIHVAALTGEIILVRIDS